MIVKISLLIRLIFLVLISISSLSAQNNWDKMIIDELPRVLEKHRKFVSIPNVSAIEEDMYDNIDFVQTEFEALGFTVRLLESSTLPVFLAEKSVNRKAKTILFYLHLDGQAADPDNWDQEDPFVPVLKRQDKDGNWNPIDWSNVMSNNINPEWRIFGRAVADDKGPIMMMLTALKLLDRDNQKLKHNIKVILDLQEEAGSEGFLSTLDKYKSDYAADYMIIMDGPAHNSNRPTLTFGCRGIATCSVKVYGAKLPQHSGHFGNYAPNPVFTLSHLLASMKDDLGRVTIENYYEGIDMNKDVRKLLTNVPDKESDIKAGIGIHSFDNVGNGYQEALQYPSLNVRHIETSWKGPGLKTVIPEYVIAHLDVRLVSETDGAIQIQKVKHHIEKQGFLVIDREPTDEERLNHRKIVKFIGDSGVNAFRTEMDAPIGQKLISELEKAFGQAPVSIRTMGGTVPIIPAINTLEIPAIIVPMVNMDNNQHNPNENLRIGNMIQGIKMCMVILNMEL